MTEATVGPLNIGTTSGEVDLDAYHFLETSFEGFDFAEYTDALIGRNWLIHPLAGDRSTGRYTTVSRVPFLWRARQLVQLPQARTADDPGLTAGRLRSTYLKAKNGAKDVGDNTAAAEFFIHEMRYKRKTYLEHGNQSGWSTLQWVLNWGYNLTAGYGERPFRTVLFSIAVILLFGGIYSLQATLPFGAGVTFSFQAFVALVLGSPAAAGDLSTIAAFEAFVGAFMIALFVFTLTRSIRR